eukprot:TRINITY_DN110888_c0_g1_i1.p1 TRINITY_DN110888_c0_g1~~TRINITY_DN110888_c0_g1_i1.p1  ORF type:complete len:814 (+),score=171.72 TRINITY_DN110888_c0_g1_i1:193-2634(+)
MASPSLLDSQMDQAEPIPWQRPLLALVKLTAPEAHTFLRSFGKPLAQAITLLNAGGIAGVPQHELQQPLDVLSQAAELLAPSLQPTRRLEFALCANTDEASFRQLFEKVGSALKAMLRTCRSGDSGAMDAVLRQWNACSAAFFAACREVGSAHALFVLLDVKGDQALLEQAGRWLCTLLAVNAVTLRECLIPTKPWIYETLKVLGNQAVPDRHLTSEVGSSSCPFWERYFTHAQFIAWPDFLSAFEEWFMLGKCPVDVLDQLRDSVDSSRCFKVSRSVWTRLTQKSEGIVNLVGSLVAAIRMNPGRRVYREVPLEKHDSPTPKDFCVPKALLQDASAASNASRTPQNPDPHGQPPKGKDSGARADQSGVITPYERSRHRAQRPAGENKTFSWEEYCAQLWLQHRPFWAAENERQSAKSIATEEGLRCGALRAVVSNISASRKAMVMRVVAGGLQQSEPLIKLPASVLSPPAKKQHEADACVVVCANGSQLSGMTRFGRDAARSTALPDHLMNEPIASHSHFGVVYEQQSNSYKLMDSGSKWGTFVNVSGDHALSCGDWIRVGNVEFIIRYCGGGCDCVKRHSHYKLHGMRVRRDMRLSGGGPSQGWPTGVPGPYKAAGDLPDDQSVSSGEAPAFQRSSNMPLRLSSSRKHGWAAASVRLAETNNTPQEQLCLMPTPPLEIDFVSGARMGEKVVLNDRYCTLGRSDDNTVQVSDAAVANVSRTHCVFEFKNGRWVVRDNNSTNGTWRRMSCILEPSKPQTLAGGEWFLAGVHEFKVEEAQLSYWFAPSKGKAALRSLARDGTVAPAGACSKLQL